MGLTKTNYYVKNLGITLPTAYAFFDDIKKIGKDKFRAYFKVQSSRENAQNLTAIEIKYVDFEWDRKTSLVATAYLKSKELIKTLQYDFNETGEMIHKEVMVDNIFTGWLDDIIRE